MPTFILNDESQINSYGFRVPNNGGNFARFDANPVMTDSHNTSLAGVLGSWLNRRFDGSNMLADTNFDTADPNVKPIEDKVNRGFIKGASMGISFDPSLMVLGSDGIYNLSSWQLMEAAICAVPSNQGALRLFNKQGVLLSASDIKLSLSTLGLNAGGYTPYGGNAGSFSHIRTVDDFEKLSESAKMDMKLNHSAAYAHLFGVSPSKGLNHNSALQNQLDFHSARVNAKLDLHNQPINYTASKILTVDDFEKLSEAEKMDMKLKHTAAYHALFS